MNRKEKYMESAINKLNKAKNFGSDCTLTSDESNVICEALNNAANVLRLVSKGKTK